MKKILLTSFATIMTITGFIVQALAYELGPVEIHGFASQGYLKSSDNNYLGQSKDGSFAYDEIGVNFSSNLTEKLRFGMQLFARDLGDVGNNKVVVDWAFGDYHWKDELGIRAGKVKIPWGFYNEGRDVDMLRTFILLPQSIYDENQRDFMNAVQGGGIYGTLSFGSLGSIDYRDMIGTVNVDTDNNVAKSRMPLFMPSGLLYYAPQIDNNGVTCKYANSSQITWNTPLEGLRMGGTILFAKLKFYGTTTDNLNPFLPVIPAGTSFAAEVNIPHNYALSAEYLWNNLTIAGEYAQSKTESSMVGSTLSFIPDSSNTSEGYYGRVSYRFTDWFEGGTYYSVYYPNKDNKGGSNMAALGQPKFMAWQKDACLALRFDINSHWLVKLEGHIIDGTAQTNTFFTTDEPERNWQLFGAKTTFSF